jgi:nitroreductase
MEGPPASFTSGGSSDVSVTSNGNAPAMRMHPPAAQEGHAQKETGMTLDLSPDELLTTTRTVRRRLDFSRPVPREMIQDCIDVAVQAPTGGNKQIWHWMVVGDQRVKRAVANVYRRCWDATSRNGALPSFDGADPRSGRIAKILESGQYLADNIDRSPWLVIPCGTGRVLDQPTVPEQSRFWASMLPAMWSFMLAARARGLGCAWTSLHLQREHDVAQILGIPYPEVTQCGLFPVAYSEGTEFRRAQRIPGEELTHWDRW